MADLVVIKFENETGAGALMADMARLQKEYIVQLADAATIVRNADGKVKVTQAHDLVGEGALGGAFWGMLVGFLFLAPWLGAAIGAGTGALMGRFTDYGIDDDFIKKVGNEINPGNSAAFFLIVKSTPDKLLEELHKFAGATVLKTSLSAAEEAKLNEALKAAPPASSAAAAPTPT
jgi:uncharacterized membrane protein